MQNTIPFLLVIVTKPVLNRMVIHFLLLLNTFIMCCAIYFFVPQETLQQLVMMPLPNVLVLGRNPLSGRC